MTPYTVHVTGALELLLIMTFPRDGSRRYLSLARATTTERHHAAMQQAMPLNISASVGMQLQTWTFTTRSRAPASDSTQAAELRGRIPSVSAIITPLPLAHSAQV